MNSSDLSWTIIWVTIVVCVAIVRYKRYSTIKKLEEVDKDE